MNDYHADNEFDKDDLNQFLAPSLVRTYGREDHVSITKSLTRTLKEICRSTCCFFPFKRITVLMVWLFIERVAEVLDVLYQNMESQAL